MSSANTKTIFVTGATGFIGRHLIQALLARNHTVKALVRPGSEKKLPSGCTCVTGDPLQFQSFTGQIQPADTFVHLIGVAHPSPAKAREFNQIDLESIRVALRAAQEAGVKHFVYLSVAQPAPIMGSYIAVRKEGERLVRESGMNATFVRPWYVLGPGRQWPRIISPLYWIFECIPSTREAARRLGFVTIDQMTSALVRSIENHPSGIRILDVPALKS